MIWKTQIKTKKTCLGHWPSTHFWCDFVQVSVKTHLKALRAFLPVPADQGELTRLTLALCLTSHGSATGNQFLSLENGARAVPAPHGDGRPRNPGWMGFRARDGALKEVSGPAPPGAQRHCQAPSLKRRFFQRNRAAKAKTRSHKLDSQCFNKMGENDKTKTPTKQSNQTKEASSLCSNTLLKEMTAGCK